MARISRIAGRLEFPYPRHPRDLRSLPVVILQNIRVDARVKLQSLQPCACVPVGTPELPFFLTGVQP
jgi:hypothetical protein